MDIFNILTLPTAKDIRGARNYIGWTQKELGKRVGITAPNITNIENGKQNPTKENLEKIAQVFGNEEIKFDSRGGFIVDRNIVTVYEG
ncbi:helix-turn-helix domain-containing protein, partial [Pseudomonadota bacterium]